MPILRVRNIGSKGVITDLPSFELPPEGWTNARNLRFVANRVEKVGGYFPVLTEGMPAKPPLAILYRNNTSNQLFGTEDALYMTSGRQHLNVSKLIDPNGGTGDANIFKYSASPDSTWYYTTLSNAVVMNTPRDVPQGFISSESRFKDLPGWGYPTGPTGPLVDWRCGRLRSYRNYLIALDMTEGGINLPQRVRWSNVAFVNQLPPDWIENDEAKDGGFNDLTDANGRIVDGIPLRDSFVIYTDKETYLMEYVGGLLIFQFKKLFSDAGILAPECAVEFEGKHFVITQDDIFVHNGSTRQPIASARTKKFLIEEISSTNPLATKVFAYTPAKEIWVTYVGNGQTDPDNPDLSWTCNKCAVWNWEWDTWTFFDIPPSYDVNMAPPPDLTTPEWADMTDPEDYWDSAKWQSYQWSTLGKDFVKNVPYIASPDGCLYTLDIGKEQLKFVKSTQTVSKQPVIAELLRTHLDMDEMVENIRMCKFIKTITPQFRGTGQINCYIGGSDNPTEEPTWDNYQLFDIETDIKIDGYSNNRYPAIKFVDLSEGEWSFQGYDIDFVVEGNR